MSVTQEKQQTPAYSSFVTTTNTIDLLKADGVPPKFDRSILGSMSGSSQSQIMVTFRYLNFIDENDRTTEVLKDLVYADREQRKEIWRKILTNSYPYILNPEDDFNLEVCAPSTFKEKFEDQGINGSTLNKAIRFFLAAAEFAEIKISPHVKKNYKSRRSTPSKSSKKPTQKKPTPQNTQSQNGIATKKPLTDTQTQLIVTKGYEILQALLQKLPSNFRWTEYERNKWIAAHTAVLDLHVEIVEDDYEDYEDYDEDE